MFIIAGVVIIYFTHRVNYTVYSRISVFIYLISIPLLLYTLFFGANLNDANRFIKLPIINLTFQASDVAKLGLFMYLSRQLSRKQEIIKNFKQGYLPLLVSIFIILIRVFIKLNSK
jgi:cell division protein FtsW